MRYEVYAGAVLVYRTDDRQSAIDMRDDLIDNELCSHVLDTETRTIVV